MKRKQTESSPTESPEEPEAAPEATGEPAPQAGPTDPIAPLWDDRLDQGKDAYATQSQFKATTVFRLVADPTKPGKAKRVMLGSLPPSATHDDIQEQWGGGDFLIAMKLPDNTFAGWKQIPIEGTPKMGTGSSSTSGPNGKPSPLHEAQSGLFAIEGLKPEMNMLLGLMQVNNAQLREDSRHTLDVITAMVGSGHLRGGQSDQMVTYLQQQLDEERRQNRDLRESVSRIERTFSQHRVEQAGKHADPGQVLTHAIAERAGPLIDMVGNKLLGGGGNGAPPAGSS